MPFLDAPRLAAVGRPLADLLLPVACPGCGAAGHAPCQGCRRAVMQAGPRIAASATPSGPTVVSVGAFEGPLRALIIAHKERGRIGLASFLGTVLADAVVLALADPEVSSERGALQRIVLVPVPSQPGTVRRRGNDTVASITGACARVLVQGGIPAGRSRWLFHTRRVHDQADLDAKARSSNVVGAFTARPTSSSGRPGTAVVVVDDITTTGATLSEAVRALVAAGVDVAAAATLAATVRRTEVPSPRDERHGVTLEGASGLVRWPDRH